jgi:hypothetical protein
VTCPWCCASRSGATAGRSLSQSWPRRSAHSGHRRRRATVRGSAQQRSRGRRPDVPAVPAQLVRIRATTSDSVIFWTDLSKPPPVSNNVFPLVAPVAWLRANPQEHLSAPVLVPLDHVSGHAALTALPRLSSPTSPDAQRDDARPTDRGGTLANVAAALITPGLAVLLTVTGIAFLTNYRQLATRHIQAAQRWSPRFRRRPARRTRLVLLDRVLGAVLAVVGAALIVLTTVDLIVGPGRFVQYGP